MISRSRLVLRGLIDRTSFGANRASTGPESEESLESRETMMVPLLFLLWNFGLRGTGSCRSLSSSEDPDDESDRVGGAGLVKMVSSLIARSDTASDLSTVTGSDVDADVEVAVNVDVDIFEASG